VRILTTLSTAILLLSSALFSYEHFTFLVTADPHVGRNQLVDNEANLKNIIDDMNSLPGTTLPISGEAISPPKGVLIAGDLTDNGRTDWTGFWWKEWRDGFEGLFQTNGLGRLAFPVYEGYGNHDFSRGDVSALTAIYLRNRTRSTPVNTSENGLHYSWDWEGIHFINLNLYPGQGGFTCNSLDFLRKDLKNNLQHPRQPIIVYHHYYYGAPEHRWTTQEQERAIDELVPYNVIGIFVGHGHAQRRTKRKGITIYMAPALFKNRYYLCKVKDNKMIIYSRKENRWVGRWIKLFTRP